MQAKCLKIHEKVLFYIFASEASNFFSKEKNVFLRQKLKRNFDHFWRENPLRILKNFQRIRQ